MPINYDLEYPKLQRENAELRQKREGWGRQCNALREKLHHAESLLAQCTDKANSWARECYVYEATNESGLADLIDRLWAQNSRWRFEGEAAKEQLKLAEDALAHYLKIEESPQ